MGWTLNKSLLRIICAILMGGLVGHFVTNPPDISNVFVKRSHRIDDIHPNGKSDLDGLWYVWVDENKRVQSDTFNPVYYIDAPKGQPDYMTWDTYDWVPFRWNQRLHMQDMRSK